MEFQEYKEQLTAFFRIERSKVCFGPSVLIAHGTEGSQVRCPLCGKGRIGRKDYDTILACAEGAPAKMWTDHVGGWELVFSERVVDALLRVGATGFEAHAITIGKVDSPRLAKAVRPNYYLIEITGRVDIDRQLFDEGEGDLCPICGFWSPKEDGVYYRGTG